MQLRRVQKHAPTDQQREDDACHTDRDTDDTAVLVHDRHLHPIIIGMMTAIFVMVRGRHQLGAVGQKRDDQERQQRTRRDQPGQEIRVVEEIHRGPYPFSVFASSGMTDRRLR